MKYYLQLAGFLLHSLSHLYFLPLKLPNSNYRHEEMSLDQSYCKRLKDLPSSPSYDELLSLCLISLAQALAGG